MAAIHTAATHPALYTGAAGGSSKAEVAGSSYAGLRLSCSTRAQHLMLSTVLQCMSTVGPKGLSVCTHGKMILLQPNVQLDNDFMVDQIRDSNGNACAWLAISASDSLTEPALGHFSASPPHSLRAHTKLLRLTHQQARNFFTHLSKALHALAQGPRQPPAAGLLFRKCTVALSNAPS